MNLAVAIAELAGAGLLITKAITGATWQQIITGQAMTAYHNGQTGAGGAAIAGASTANLAVTRIPGQGFNQQTFAQALLRTLRLPVTSTNVNNLIAWQNAEGGNWNNTAYYNPLNTTLDAPGATSMNSVGVKAYTSWAQGLQATAQTLAGSSYSAIRAALQNSAPFSTFQAAVASSPWGTWH